MKCRNLVLSSVVASVVISFSSVSFGGIFSNAAAAVQAVQLKPMEILNRRDASPELLERADAAASLHQNIEHEQARIRDLQNDRSKVQSRIDKVLARDSSLDHSQDAMDVVTGDAYRERADIDTKINDANKVIESDTKRLADMAAAQAKADAAAAEARRVAAEARRAAEEAQEHDRQVSRDIEKAVREHDNLDRHTSERETRDVEAGEKASRTG